MIPKQQQSSDGLENPAQVTQSSNWKAKSKMTLSKHVSLPKLDFGTFHFQLPQTFSHFVSAAALVAHHHPIHPVILLMEEIQTTTWGVNNRINYLSTGAGFLNHQQYLLRFGICLVCFCGPVIPYLSFGDPECLQGGPLLVMIGAIIPASRVITQVTQL